MSCYSYPASLMNQNEILIELICWRTHLAQIIRSMIMKMLAKYGPYAIPSEVMPCYSHPASLVNQNEIPIDLLCLRAHLALIMSLISMKMLTNIAHLQYHKIMPHQSYTKSLVNQNEIPIELSSQRAHLALIMILTGMKILTNMTHLQYHPR